MSGNLFIVCAPSGAGKTSLVAELLKTDEKIKLSVSYTTRAPRSGELNGREYHFVSKEKFEAMIAAGEFLE
ncbi:MAG: guanylate kinase, partial [Betaproteobacteria bacterium]|nr:guanylate kinase [Betaproteobacteria bacterium]